VARLEGGGGSREQVLADLGQLLTDLSATHLVAEPASPEMLAAIEEERAHVSLG
jgi:hypothetical protein